MQTDTRSPKEKTIQRTGHEVTKRQNEANTQVVIDTKKEAMQRTGHVVNKRRDDANRHEETKRPKEATSRHRTMQRRSMWSPKGRTNQTIGTSSPKVSKDRTMLKNRARGHQETRRCNMQDVTQKKEEMQRTGYAATKR